MKTTKITPQRLLKMIDEFCDTSILVIGDIILDSYIWGNVEKICPEAPVPVVEVTRKSFMLGGAANVVSNLRTLGAQVSLCGVIGKDEAGDEVKHQLKQMNVDSDGVVSDRERLTSQKTRVVAIHHQIVRFDQEVKIPIPKEISDRIFTFLDKKWEMFDAVIVSDYAKGMIVSPLLEKIRELNSKCPKFISVDPKEQNMEHYKQMTLITPNKKEASFVFGKKIETDEDLKEAGRKMMHHLQCENLVITLGAEGMALLQRNGGFLKIPTFAKEVFDVSGAGDTVVSVLTLAMCTGAELSQAVVLANFAAGVVVGKVGTASVTLEELKRYIQVEKNRIPQKHFIEKPAVISPLSH